MSISQAAEEICDKRELVLFLEQRYHMSSQITQSILLLKLGIVEFLLLPRG